MIRISRDHPIRLQTGRQYPRELLRGAFREMRAACRAQPDVPRLGDVAVDAGEPLFTLAYEQNRIQQHGFQAVTAAGYWSYDFLQTPLDRLDLTLLRRYRVFVFCELEEYTLAILELLLRMRGIQHGGGGCAFVLHGSVGARVLCTWRGAVRGARKPHGRGSRHLVG
ncbi:hypothetical protein [Selenomonas sp.]|uniref:hypothetical protein n=1 Tax=Selenomonas sp. TaxID=2053611 RepID=UPI002A837721|nr:hypothetical protein [Selenomonas sp.]MDY4415914.1 hypothetical protein [Selenomonas sp.]